MTQNSGVAGFQTWRIDGPGQTIVFAAKGGVIPSLVYWGSALGDTEDLSAIAEATSLDVTGGMLDANPELSLMPLASRTFPGQVGMQLRRFNGEPFHPHFELGVTTSKPGGVEFVCLDRTNHLRLTLALHFDLEIGTVEAQSRLESEIEIYCDWLSAPVFPASQASDDMLDFSGKWIGEFALNKTPWGPGARLRDNPTGRTGHEHFPGLIVPERGCTNTQGRACAFHYAWSGGHRMVAEELSDGRRQIQFGHASGTRTEAGKKFASATLYAAYSKAGLNGCAVAMQRLVRSKIVKFPDAQHPRPVHYNCWEAVYFNHKLDDLKAIANKAADIGAERFVLDDGWFKNRKDDFRALGDWVIDANKYPNGLTPLIDHVKSLGMTFGIWFEPEMVNMDSDVYREHPDWLLGEPDQIPGRQQYVLDMASSSVRKYLFDCISKILTENDIDYIKWDHNRVLPIASSAQTLGTYGLIDSLRKAHPNVEIESCSSGGGRIDYGILARTHRVWLSDSNDAVERMRIQHDAALFLPSNVVGSHVGPRKCHTSGREMDIRVRAWTAAQRHMGFEMNPNELTDEETKVLKTVTQWWKNNRDWMMNADVLRLDSSDPAVLAEQQNAADGTQFVAFVGSQGTSKQVLPRPIRLAGLNADAIYRVDLVNRIDAHHLSRGNQALKSGALELSGRALMTVGLTLPWSFPQSLWVLKGVRLGITKGETNKKSADANVNGPSANSGGVKPSGAALSASQGISVQASIPPTATVVTTNPAGPVTSSQRKGAISQPKIHADMGGEQQHSPTLKAALDRIVTATNQRQVNGAEANDAETLSPQHVKMPAAPKIRVGKSRSLEDKQGELSNAVRAKSPKTATRHSTSSNLKVATKFKKPKLSDLGSGQPGVSSITSWTQAAW